MKSQFSDMTSLSEFFDTAVFLSSSLVTGSRFMSISWLVLELWQFFVYKGFTRNVSNKKLLIAAKFQGYSFYRFWVSELLREKQKGVVGVILLPSPHLLVFP